MEWQQQQWNATYTCIPSSIYVRTDYIQIQLVGHFRLFHGIISAHYHQHQIADFDKDEKYFPEVYVAAANVLPNAMVDQEKDYHEVVVDVVEDVPLEDPDEVFSDFVQTRIDGSDVVEFFGIVAQEFHAIIGGQRGTHMASTFDMLHILQHAL